MDPVTVEQIRRFVVARLAPADATEQQLDRALDAVLEKAPLSSWEFTDWYGTDAVSFEELQRIVDAAIG